MRAALLSGALVLLSACAASRASAPIEPATAPVSRAPQEPPEVKDPNFILLVSENVPNPKDDGISFTKVFADGREVGKTAIAHKSEERALKLKLPAGNILIRLEHWVLPGMGEPIRLSDALQPRERFVRVEDNAMARLELRFSDGEASNTLSLSREAGPR